MARHRGPDGRRSVNKAIRALWTPTKAPGSVPLQSLAWAALGWGSRQGQGMGASGGGGVWKDLVPSRKGERAGRARGARLAPAEPCPPAPADGGRAAMQCCHPVAHEGTAAPRPWLRQACPPAPPFPPSRGQLSGSCKDGAQLKVLTLNSKRGRDPVVTSCPHRDASFH